MANIKVRIKVEQVVEFDKEHYQDQYLEHCEEEGETPLDEVPDEFAIEQYNQELESGELSLDEVLEQAIIVAEAV